MHPPTGKGNTLSRYNPNHHVEPIYNAAQKWRDTSLMAGLSVFADGKELLSRKLLDELDQRFVKNLDAGEGDFLSKLKVQLSEGSPDCRQLMAESLWLTLLFPSNVGAAKKRENVLEIWSWSGEELNATHPLLADGVLEGIGSAGTAYNTHRWRELVFLIGALRDFTARDGSEREQIASDPWAFSSWLSRTLLHKSADGRVSPCPGQSHPTASVTGMPSAVKPFRTATRTWNSAT